MMTIYFLQNSLKVKSQQTHFTGITAALPWIVYKYIFNCKEVYFQVYRNNLREDKQSSICILDMEIGNAL